MKAVLPTLPAVPVVIAICLIINVTSTVQAQTGGDEGQVRTVSAEQPPLIEPLQSSPDLDFKSLLRPRFSLRAEWEPEADDLAIASYDLSVTVPTYPIFGPPPPLISGGAGLTMLYAPTRYNLPDDLFDFTLGAAWIRPLNERWTLRWMLQGALASDLKNTTIQAWQIRGGGFAMYSRREELQWAFGVMVTGRENIPVLPAAGVIWDSSPKMRWNLMLPNPRLMFLVSEREEKQNWLYLGGGFAGGTWAYQDALGNDDRLTYSEWRIAFGWEHSEKKLPGIFRPPGTSTVAELAYLLGREFEFDAARPDLSVGDTLLLRTGINF